MFATLMSIILAIQSTGAPQTPGVDDRAAIIETVLNYADGYYEGSAERMTQALHPLLSKRALIAVPGGTPRLSTMNSEMLIEGTRGGRGKLAAELRRVKADVLDVSGNVATARVFTTRFNDYLHLVKTEGGWRIVNVLWTPPVASPTAADGTGVASAATAYLQAMAAKNAAAVEPLLHPAVTYRQVQLVGLRPILIDVMLESLLDAVAGGRSGLPADTGNQPVTVLDVYEDIAAVKIAVGPFVQYAHLARQGGRWRIVNTLTSLQAGR